jgi:hypothetical protein
MHEDKVQTGISLTVEAMERLKKLATNDSRTVSGEIEALVNQEWERRQPSAAVPPQIGKRSLEVLA